MIKEIAKYIKLKIMEKWSASLLWNAMGILTQDSDQELYEQSK